MATYWQRGESLDYTNKGTALIHHGDVVPITDRIGVAGCDIPSGAVGSLHVTGVFIMPKASGVAFTVGQSVFWDGGVKNIVATGTTSVGWVTEPAAAADTTVKVKIG